jgi:hypothetical protein
LLYTFEVATDAAFANKVFMKDDVAPGTGQTSLKLPDPLATGKTYYWHAKAQDGANTGVFSAPASFAVYTPTVIQAPVLVSPVNNAKVSSLRPRLTFSNAATTNPTPPIQYLIEISDVDDFATKINTWVVTESAGGQTSFDVPVDLPAYAKRFVWHVRASDQTTTGAFSSTQAFRTPDPPVVAPPPPSEGGGGGGGGGGNAGPAAGDMLNLSSVNVYNSPSDIASWPITTKITRLDMQNSGGSSPGLTFTFSALNTWPNTIPPGFTGGIQYTVWAVVKVGGQWNTSGFIEMWQGRGATGAPILSDFAKNWAYDSRWGPMAGYQPQAGEQMGFFVSAGDARGNLKPTSVRERSNVVLVNLPANDSGSFGF